VSSIEFDPAPFIASAKKALKDNNNVAAHFSQCRDNMLRQVQEVIDLRENNQSVVPELAYSAIHNNKVSTEDINQIRKRGCVIVRGVFEKKQVQDWNNELGQYLDDNRYYEKAKDKAGLDDYFGDLKDTTPQIFGVYWSRPQVMARQADTMAVTKRFLNHLWNPAAPAGPEFDPDHDLTYADRTRRRSPGDNTLGLSPHVDAGSYERWVDPAYHQIYKSIFNGNLEQYDPWRAAYRTQTREFESPAVSSMFRTFQGWTALTEQGPGDGTLQLLPISNAISYVLLRALQGDVPENELCLAKPGRALGIDEEWHPDIYSAITTIQTVEPGDTVWWHPDVIHAVGGEHNGSEFASVIYIGASPDCSKNKAYAQRQAAHFMDGRSAPDFAAEDYEVDFSGRATVDDLTDLGKRQMNIA